MEVEYLLNHCPCSPPPPPHLQNNLSGTFPSAVVGLTALLELVLFSCPMVGPFRLASGLPSLRLLSLFTSQLTGPFPADWSGAPMLQTVNLGDNHFQGTFPTAFTGLDQLRFLELGTNFAMSGSVASSWSGLTSLTCVPGASGLGSVRVWDAPPGGGGGAGGGGSG